MTSLAFRHWRLAALALYTLLLFTLLPVQSLWVDELMQTAASRDLPLGVLLHDEIPRTAGQVPLVYLLQKASIILLGYSSFSARLPAAFLAVLACVGVWRLSCQLHLQYPSLAATIFATFPLQLRYATEARPYSQALCLTVWLSVVFIDLRAEATLSRCFLYFCVLALSLYTQPYTLFVAAAHILFSLWELRSGTTRRNGALFWNLLVSMTLAVLAFLPWYIFARAGWRKDVNASNLHFRMHVKLPLEIARELTGAGYLSSLAVLLLCVIALRFAQQVAPAGRLFLVVVAVVPAALAVAADAAFDYFFAVRQIIFILPSLAILAAIGVESKRFQRFPTKLALLLLALNIGYSIRWFTKPRESWERAAAALDNARHHGACLMLLPAESARYYDFYVPGLSNAFCLENYAQWPSTVAVAVSPYFRNSAAEAALTLKLQSAGFKKPATDSKSEPRILTFKR